MLNINNVKKIVYAENFDVKNSTYEEKINNIIELDCSYCNLEKLPDNLLKCERLICKRNKLSTLPNLPNCIFLDCQYNKIVVLPNLPKCVTIYCTKNNLISISDLPECKTLECYYNLLTYLPYIPKCSYLGCSHNQLKSLLPQNNNNYNILIRKSFLKCVELICDHNCLTDLPDLLSCEFISCTHNNIENLDKIPLCKHLECSNNKLKSLPLLSKCTYLSCKNNQISELPIINEIENLYCKNTNILNVPYIPFCKIFENDFNRSLQTIKIYQKQINKKLKIINNTLLFYLCKDIVNLIKCYAYNYSLILR